VYILQRLAEPWPLAAGSLRPGLSNKRFLFGGKTPERILHRQDVVQKVKMLVRN
jgi:hypothetical protein